MNNEPCIRCEYDGPGWYHLFDQEVYCEICFDLRHEIYEVEENDKKSTD